MMKNESMYTRGYESLAAAIVVRAAKDYQNAIRKLRKRPKDTEAAHRKMECEVFFRKEMCRYYDLDGELVIARITELEKKDEKIKGNAI